MENVDESPLPIDFDGSLDPSQLPNVTLGNHSIMEASHRKPYSPMSLSSKYNGAGRRSPAKTIKEYDQHVSDLTKENFNLKLRIYHLEEWMGRQYGDEQNVFKTNIELKIMVDHLKNELAEKQVYLQKAAQAVSTLTLNHQQAEEAIKQQCVTEVDDLKAQLDKAAQECEISRKQAEESSKEIGGLLDGLKLAQISNEDLSEKFNSAQKEIDLLETKLKDRDGKVHELKDFVSSLQKQLERKDRDVMRLSVCFGEEKRVESTSILEPQHLQDKYDDQVDEVKKMKGKISNLEEELMLKDNKLEATEKELREKLEELDNKAVKLGKLEQTTNALMTKVRNTGKKNEDQDAKMKALESKVTELIDLLDTATKERNQIVNDSMVVQETNDRLVHQMEEVKEMAEGMVQNLGKKQGEMSAFQEQLHKAMDALTCSERAVEELQMQLKKERAEFESRLKNQAQLFENTTNPDCNKEMPSLRQQLVELKHSMADQNVAHLRRERDVADFERQNKHMRDRERDLKAERESQDRKLMLLEREIQMLRLELESRDFKIGCLQQDTVHINRPCHEGSRLDVNVQVLPLNVTEELHLLLDNFRQQLLDVKVLQDSFRNLQQSHNNGDTSDIDFEATQKVFKKLEEGLDRNSQLHQHLLNFLQAHDPNKGIMGSNDTTTQPRQLSVSHNVHRPSFLPRPVGRRDDLIDTQVHSNPGLTRKDSSGLDTRDVTYNKLQLSDLHSAGRESVSPQRLSDCEIPSHIANTSGDNPALMESRLMESGELLEHIVTDVTLLDHSLTDDAKEGNLRHSDSRDYISLDHYFEPRLQDRTSLDHMDSEEDGYRHYTLDPKGHGQGVAANQTMPQDNLIDLFTEPRSPLVNGSDNGSDTVQGYQTGTINDCSNVNVMGRKSGELNNSYPFIKDRSSQNLMDRFSNITTRSLDFHTNYSSGKKNGEKMFDSTGNRDNGSDKNEGYQMGINDGRHSNVKGRNISYSFVTDRSTLNRTDRFSNITTRSHPNDISGNKGGEANETLDSLVISHRDVDEVDKSESRLSMESGRGGSLLSGVMETDSQSDPDIVKSTATERRNSWADELAPYKETDDGYSPCDGTVDLRASMEKGRAGNTSHPSMRSINVMSPSAMTMQQSFTSPSSSTGTMQLEGTCVSSPERQTTNGSEKMANSSSVFDITLVDWNNSGEKDPEDPTLSSMLVTDFTFLYKRLSVLSQSIMPSTGEQSFNNTTIDVDKLHARLAHLERIILMQKEEITVYESLLASMGYSVPLSVNEGSDGTGEGCTSESLLRQHLTEIRKLRQRLENLDLGTDSDQLLIFHRHTQQRITHQEHTISQLQQKIVEKEDKWHRETTEAEHRWNREKSQLVQKLETTRAEMENQHTALEEQEKMIESLKESLWQEDEEKKETGKEMEKLRREKAELEEDLVKREREYLDMEKTMFKLEMSKEEVESQKKLMKSNLEEHEKQVVKLKNDIDHYKESCRSLRDVVRSRNHSLQEQVQCLKKMAHEKADVDQKLSQLQTQIEEMKGDADGMRSEIEEKKSLEEELVQLKDDFAYLKNACDLKTRDQMQILGEKAELETKMSKLNEEKLKMKADNEQRMTELRGEIENSKKEMTRVEFELGTKQGLGEEISNLRSMLEKRRNLESELRSRVSELESDLQKEELKRSKIEDELKEKTEKVKKRDRQCQYLCDRFKKLDTAYTKQDDKLKYKTEAVNSMKRQVQVYEQTISSFSKENDQGTMKELFQELMLTKKQVADLLVRLEESSKQLSEVHMDSCESISSSSTTTTTTTTEITSLKSTSLNNTTTSTMSEATNAIRLDGLDDLEGVDAGAIKPSPMKNYDVQSLSAVYKLDQHEKARKEAGECLVSLSGVEARVEDRLKVYKAKSVTESVDYSTLREAGIACQQMRTCLNEICTIISLAWITELPPVNDLGRFYDPESAQEKEELKFELNELQSKYAVLDMTNQDQQEKLNVFKQRQKDLEHSVCRQLVKTTNDLEQAKENLDMSRGILQQVNTSAQANSKNDRPNVSFKSGGDSNKSQTRISIQSENE